MRARVPHARGVARALNTFHPFRSPRSAAAAASAAAAVFFYIDPLFLEDPAMDGVKSLTLSYTFFRTGEQEVMDVAHELAKRDDGSKPADSASEKIRAWTAAVARKTGVDAAAGASGGGAAAAGAGAAAQAQAPASS